MATLTDPPPSAAILNLILNVWATKAAAVFARLNMADALAAGPESAQTIATRANTHPDATYRLLRALAATGILERVDGDRFALTPIGHCLRSNVPGSMRSLLVAETAPGHWLPWGDLEHSVRTGTPATLKTFGKATWDYYAEHADEGEEFSRGMSAISEMVTQAFLASYPIGDAALVVDVGGAHGALLAAVLQAAPRARGVLIDRPNVVAAARPTLERMGVVDRVTCVGGDFFEAVPSGADVYLLKAILHDWNDDECVRILSTVRRAMPAHGRIVVVEMLIDAEGPPSPAAPLMDLNMLVMLTGRERTQAEFADVFRRAGLDLSRVVPTPSPFVALEARRA